LVLSGTSMASGVVSGAVADLLQANPALPPDQLKAILMASASKTFPQYSSTHDPATGITYVSQYDAFTIGAGYLDLQNVLAEVSNPPPANASRSAVRNRGESLSQNVRPHNDCSSNKWRRSDLPAWLTREVYVKQIQPALASAPKARIRSVLGVSEPYSIYIQTGQRIPHPRHWHLAELVGVGCVK
jgi:Subtilase family